MEHTNTEWKVSSGTLIVTDEARIIANTTPIAVEGLELPYKEARANAKRICQCVNNFDALLEACKRGLKLVKVLNPRGDPRIEKVITEAEKG